MINPSIHGYELNEKLRSLTYGEVDISNATFHRVLRQLNLERFVEQFELPNDVIK